MRSLNIGAVGDSKRCQHVFSADVYLDVVRDFRHKNSVVWDLDVFPYPFADGEFDFVFCSHVLEHLRFPQRALCELVRIGKVLRLFVPHRFSRLGRVDGVRHLNSFSHLWFVGVLDQLDVQYSVNLDWGLFRPLDLRVDVVRW